MRVIGRRATYVILALAVIAVAGCSNSNGSQVPVGDTSQVATGSIQVSSELGLGTAACSLFNSEEAALIMSNPVASEVPADEKGRACGYDPQGSAVSPDGPAILFLIVDPKQFGKGTGVGGAPAVARQLIGQDAQLISTTKADLAGDTAIKALNIGDGGYEFQFPTSRHTTLSWSQGDFAYYLTAMSSGGGTRDNLELLASRISSRIA